MLTRPSHRSSPALLGWSHRVGHAVAERLAPDTTGGPPTDPMPDPTPIDPPPVPVPEPV